MRKTNGFTALIHPTKRRAEAPQDGNHRLLLASTRHPGHPRASPSIPEHPRASAGIRGIARF